MGKAQGLVTIAEVWLLFQELGGKRQKDIPHFLPSVMTSCYGAARHQKTYFEWPPRQTVGRHEPLKLMLDAVIAVITNGEKVLLIQRAPGIRGGGYWAPVSGEVEAGESQEAAVARKGEKGTLLTS